MTSIDHGLTGRDVIAKTFSTRTRRGYDPIEVDAYLEQLATHIDSLLAEIERLELERVDFASAPPPPPPPGAADLAPADDMSELAEAPPPPVAPAVAAAPAVAPTAADSEAAELVLRMAQKASGEALEEAKSRADEIVADAEFKASEIQREADRKAFEVSTRTQGELRSIETEIESRKSELDNVRGAIASQRDRLRSLGLEITSLADGIQVDDDTEATVLDLSDTAAADAEAEAADLSQ